MLRKGIGESQSQYKQRMEFIDKLKETIPDLAEERYQSISLAWINMKVLGCRYKEKLEDIIFKVDPEIKEKRD